MRLVKLANIIEHQKRINVLSVANRKNIFEKMSFRVNIANIFHVNIFNSDSCGRVGSQQLIDKIYSPFSCNEGSHIS